MSNNENEASEPLGGEPACLSPWVCIRCGRVIEQPSRRYVVTGQGERSRQTSEPGGPNETIGPFHETCVSLWLDEQRSGRFPKVAE